MKAKKKNMANRNGGAKNGIKKRLLRKCAKSISYSPSSGNNKRQVNKRVAMKIKLSRKVKNGVMTEDKVVPAPCPSTPKRVRKPPAKFQEENISDSCARSLDLDHVQGTNGCLKDDTKVKKVSIKIKPPLSLSADLSSSEKNVEEKTGISEVVDKETELKNLKMVLAENGTAATLLITPLKDCNVKDVDVGSINSAEREALSPNETNTSKDSKRAGTRKPSWRLANGNAVLEFHVPGKEIESQENDKVRENPEVNGISGLGVDRVEVDARGPEKRAKLDTLSVTCGDLVISCRGGGPLPNSIPGLFSPLKKEDEEDLVDEEDDKRCDLSPQIACDPSTEAADELALNNNNNFVPAIAVPPIAEKFPSADDILEDIQVKEPLDENTVNGKEPEKECHMNGQMEEAVTVTLVSAPIVRPTEPKAPIPKPLEVGTLIRKDLPFVSCCCKESTEKDVRLRSEVENDKNLDYFCEGVDLVNCSRIGCYRVVAPELSLYRVSRRCPFKLLCPQHAVRLKLHQCCPICGYFCTEGTGVMLCTGNPVASKNGAIENRDSEMNWTSHLFHKKCALTDMLQQLAAVEDPLQPEAILEDASPDVLDDMTSKIVCPHCGDKEDIKEISLKFKSTAPVSVPERPDALRRFAAAIPRNVTFLNSVEHSALRFVERTTASTLAKANTEANLISEMNISSSKKHFLKYLQKNDMPRVLAAIQTNTEGKSSDLIKTRFKSSGGQSPLHVAVGNKNIYLVHALIIAGANPNAMDDNFVTPLMLAVRLDEPVIAKYLIAAGAEKFHVDQNGMTAVHIAAELGHLAVLKGILEDHPDMLNVTDNMGLTALMYAAKNGRTDVVNYLASFWPHQTNVRMVDRDQNTPLHWAAASGASQAISKLIKFGSDVDAVNNLGRTALHTAVIKGHEECVLMLLVNRANISITDIEGKTALEYCSIEAEDQLKYKDSLTNLKSSENLTASHEMIKLCLLQTMTIRTHLSSPMKSASRVLCRDISLGKEKRRIQCVSTMDDAVLPNNFRYITKNLYTSSSLDRPYMNPDKAISCKCPSVRSNFERMETETASSDELNCFVCVSDSCQCSSHGYDAHERLTFGTAMDENSFVNIPLIQECNELCGCDLRICANRVVQKGSKCELQVFRSKNKGWGVKTVGKIVRGTFVCAYVGEIIDRTEAAQRSVTCDESYFFDLHGGIIFLDATNYGNVARFINHSCSPNLVAVKVMYDHTDKRYPHIAFFAKTDIEADEEITFDYGPRFWKSKFINCKCEASECKYKVSDESGHSEDGEETPVSGEEECGSDSDHSLV